MSISDLSTYLCSSDLTQLYYGCWKPFDFGKRVHRLISNFERLCDERERDIVLAVPVDFETVAVVGNLTRRLRPRTPTQRGGMKVVRVCQVHNIIDERSEEHTSELQSLMRISYAALCLNQTHQPKKPTSNNQTQQ